LRLTRSLQLQQGNARNLLLQTEAYISHLFIFIELGMLLDNL
jgi:hypothetical protein